MSRMKQKLTTPLTAIALSGFVVLSGCGGGRRPETARRESDYDVAERRAPNAAVERAAAEAKPRAVVSAPAAPAADPMSAPASNGDVFHGSLAFPTGVRETSVLLLEKTAPRQVRLGQPYSYELRVTNLTDAMIGDVVVTEKYPNEAETKAADGDAGQKYVVGELGPRQTRTITVNGTASKQGVFGICTSVTYRPSLCSSTEVINPSLRLVKTGPAESLLCEDIVYRYVVSNTGTGTAREVKIEDNLPPGLAIVEGGQRVNLNVGPLDEGKSREYTVKLRASSPGKYASRAVARNGADQAPSEEIVTTVKSGKLVVETPAPDTAFVNKVLIYPITVKNTGDGEARDAILDLKVEGSSEILGFTENGMVPEEPTGKTSIRKPLGTLAPGQSVIVNLAVRARFGGETKLSATARNDCLQPVTSLARTNILTVSALLLEVYDLEDPVRIGDETTYRIEVKNQGSAPDQNIQIVATLPESETFVKAGGPTKGTADGKKITFEPLPVIKPGETVRWEVRVKTTAADDARFQIDLTSKTLTKPVTENEATRIY